MITVTLADPNLQCVYQVGRVSAPQSRRHPDRTLTLSHPVAVRFDVAGVSDPGVMSSLVAAAVAAVAAPVEEGEGGKSAKILEEAAEEGEEAEINGCDFGITKGLIDLKRRSLDK